MVNPEFHTDNIVSIYQDSDIRFLALLKSKPDGSLYVSLINSEDNSSQISYLQSVYIDLAAYFKYYRSDADIIYLETEPAYKQWITARNSVAEPFKLIKSIFNFEINITARQILLQTKHRQYPQTESERNDWYNECWFLLFNFDGEIIRQEIIYKGSSDWTYPYGNDFISYIDHETLMHVGEQPFYQKAFQIWKPVIGELLQLEMFGEDAFEEDEWRYEYIGSYSFHRKRRLFAVILFSPTTGVDALKTFQLETDYSLTQLASLAYESSELQMNHAAFNSKGDELALLEFIERGKKNRSNTQIICYSIDDLSVPTRITEMNIRVNNYEFLNIKYLTADLIVIVLGSQIHVYDLDRKTEIAVLEMDESAIHFISENTLFYVRNNLVYIYDHEIGEQPEYAIELKNRAKTFNQNKPQPATKPFQVTFTEPENEPNEPISFATIKYYLGIALLILWMLWQLAKYL